MKTKRIKKKPLIGLKKMTTEKSLVEMQREKRMKKNQRTV
jgi:hypothetical protein